MRAACIFDVLAMFLAIAYARPMPRSANLGRTRTTSARPLPMAQDNGWRPSAETAIGICLYWRLRIKCGLCDRSTKYLLRDVGNSYGAHRTVAEIVARLWCGTCHRPSVEVQLILTDQTGVIKAVRLPI